MPNAELPGGPPTDAVFTRFGVPAISENGSVAFAASWKSATARGAGIWSNGMLLVTSGDPVPGISGATFQSFKDPVSSENGPVVFLATITGEGITPDNNTIIGWGSPGNPLNYIAREGDVAAMTGGATFRAFRSVSLHQEEAVFLASLNPGTGAPLVDATNDVGLWSFGSSYGTSLPIREGDVIEGRIVRSFRALQTVLGSPGQGRSHVNRGLLYVLALYTDGTQGVLGPMGGVIGEWARTPYAIDALPGAVVQRVGPPAAFGLSQDFAAVASLRGVRRGITKAILAGVGAEQKVVARVGGSVPGAGGATFAQLRDPLYNGAQIAFPAKLGGAGVSPTNDEAIIAGPVSAPVVLAREGAQAPELPAGAVFRSFASLALPRVFEGPVDPSETLPVSRGPIFTASLVPGAGGVTAENDRGAWAVDSKGVTRCLFREGDTIAGKTLKNFSFLQAVSGSPGVTRAFNENYGATWRAQFTDGSSALINTAIPSPTLTP